MIKTIETATKLLAEIENKAAAEARYYQGAKDGIGLLIETLKQAGQEDEADDSQDNKAKPKRKK